MRIIILLFGALCICACKTVPSSETFQPTVVKQVTFIKTVKGVEDNKVSDFIKRHWYEMDRRGVEAGIFTEYELMSCAPDSDLCDFAMIVGYPQNQGFADPDTQEAFEAIRREHEERYPEARELRSVMDIVGSETLGLIAD